eukprot:scaffold57959_cov69-Phaeocystis_antarctica.AAC.4
MHQCRRVLGRHWFVSEPSAHDPADFGDLRARPVCGCIQTTWRIVERRKEKLDAAVDVQHEKHDTAVQQEPEPRGARRDQQVVHSSPDRSPSVDFAAQADAPQPLQPQQLPELAQSQQEEQAALVSRAIPCETYEPVQREAGDHVDD